MAYYPKTRYRATIRQHEFVYWYMEKHGGAYGNAYQAALNAGYSQSYARKITTYSTWSELHHKMQLISFADSLSSKYPEEAKQIFEKGRDAKTLKALSSRLDVV